MLILNEPNFKVVLLGMSKFSFGYGFEGPGFENPVRLQDFSSAEIQVGSGTHLPYLFIVYEGTLPGSKQSPLSSAEVKHEWSCNPCLRICLNGVDRSIFTFSILLRLTVPINTVCRLIRQARGYATLCSLSRSLCR